MYTIGRIVFVSKKSFGTALSAESAKIVSQSFFGKSRCFFAQNPPSVEITISGTILFLKSGMKEEETARRKNESRCFFKNGIEVSKLGPDETIMTGIFALPATEKFPKSFGLTLDLILDVKIRAFLNHLFEKYALVPRTSRDFRIDFLISDQILRFSSGKACLVGFQSKTRLEIRFSSPRESKSLSESGSSPSR